ncbi:TPA: hypothetical protein QDB24_002980 [Burkholderia vietnamiensis]|uniref:hypothetical protein n=1 Tax=Burkholderia vietnamiensis TaxID=60552 RepID=UPI001B971CA0|nr:hypothetical protein [Burkholderia vietnamiensis]MBR7910351.1 hypothetical protein [Burkholderia vietnamiensis]HDR9274899.1 hypothetical protein [Burkholderia vietnamiensis]
MKSTTENLDYPRLDSLPEYRVEFDKLARFRVELGKCETRNIELHAAWASEQESKSTQTDAARIAEAEQLLDGRPVAPVVEQIKQNMALTDSLKRAIDSQVIVLRDLTYALSRKAAERFDAEHKQRVKRVVDALLELHAANESEQNLRDSIERLGYDAKLPFMGFVPPDGEINPHDPNSGFVSAWFRDAAEYVMTDAEREARTEREATATRRRKLAALS